MFLSLHGMRQILFDFALAGTGLINACCIFRISKKRGGISPWLHEEWPQGTLPCRSHTTVMLPGGETLLEHNFARLKQIISLGGLSRAVSLCFHFTTFYHQNILRESQNLSKNMALFKLCSLSPFASLPTFIGRIGHPTASLKRVGLIIWICDLVILAITLRWKDDKCNHNQAKKIKCVCLCCRHCFQKIRTLERIKWNEHIWNTEQIWHD